jgi:exonuclease SbcD
MSKNKSLKILHTADWHIGKQLHKIDLHEDMNLFFKWLITYIEENKIDVLLMSGDLFDHANPSQTALTQYYLFLKQLLHLKCKVIITGGNHDSPYVLNAPKDLLAILDIKVIGGAPIYISDLFVECGNEGQKIIIAAVPFLRDKDIRNSLPGESYQDKIELIRQGIKHYFNKINNHYNEHYKGLPYLVMAHLYAQGASISDSEREIQIGNQAGIEASIFGNEPHYVALGHIHKPQVVGSNHIRYSGSPIQLSFSEKEDQKEVVLIEINNSNFSINAVKLPQFRKLIAINGTLNEVKTKIENYQSASVLCDLAEILITEDNYSSEAISALEDLLVAEPKNNLRILKGKIQFKNQLKGTSELLSSNKDINDYTPVQLFEKRLEQEESLSIDKSELINAFKEILEKVSSEEQ